jgi:hypothetical protein
MRVHLPNRELFLHKRVPGRHGLEIVEHIKSGSDGHVFRGHDHDLSLDFACKVIPRLNLVGVAEGKDTWRAEIEKANRLRNQAVVHFSYKLEWIEPQIGVDCVVLVADFILGLNLRDFVQKKKREIHWHPIGGKIRLRSPRSPRGIERPWAGRL